MKAFGLSRVALWGTIAILLLWGAWGLFDAMTLALSGDYVYLRFESFGLVSPVVGAACAVFSLAALAEAARLRKSKRPALVALCLSVVVGVAPFWSLLEACDNCMS